MPFKIRLFFGPLILFCLLGRVFLLPRSNAASSAYYLSTSRLELPISSETHTASGSVRVFSTSNLPIRINVIPKLWTLDAEGNIVYLDTPPAGFNLLDHIAINPEAFELESGKSRLTRFLVKIPPEVPDGEYPVQLFFQLTPTLTRHEDEKTAAGVHEVLNVTPIFTTTLYALKGQSAPKMTITQFACSVDPQTGLSAKIALLNSGNRHARLLGTVLLSVTNQAAKPIAVYHLHSSNLIFVFPQQNRVLSETVYPADMTGKLAPGDYTVELQLTDERNLQPALRDTCHFSVSG